MKQSEIINALELMAEYHTTRIKMMKHQKSNGVDVPIQDMAFEVGAEYALKSAIVAINK